MRTYASSLALAFVLSIFAFNVPAHAGASFGVLNVSVQTRDGAPWSDGQPIVLVVRATSSGVSFPDAALAVVMQTDGERTKCLDVAMKRVSADGDVATYAGVFHPFRAATYDGRFGIGEDVQDITFAVGAAAPAHAAIPADAALPVLGPVTFDYEPPVLGAAWPAAVGVPLALALGLVALVLWRHRIAPAG